MMDDSDKTSSPPERPSQRREAYNDGTDPQEENRDADSGNHADPTERHQNRRERFTRTKSEGHLKLRVRFSKFADMSQSFDEDDDSSLHSRSDSRRPRMHSESESRRFRSSQESGIGSFGEHHTDEEEDRSEQRGTNDEGRKLRDNSDDGSNDYDSDNDGNNDENDDGFVGDDPTDASLSVGAMAPVENFIDNQSNDNNGKDVSKGAIPKRRASAIVSRSNISGESVDREDRENMFSVTESRYDRAENRKYPHDENVVETSQENEPSKQTTLHTENEMDSVQSSAADSIVKCYNEAEGKSKYSEVKASKQYGDCKTNGDERKQKQNSDEVDDIESIIERIIAEEEAILIGKSSDPTLMKSSVESLNDKDLKSLSNAMNEIIDNAANDKGTEENGISISRNNNQDKQRPSSLPSYQRDEDHCLTETTTPFSSSCPSSQKSVVAGNKAKEEPEIEEDGWAYLPMILLEDVFTLLSPKERHQASQVCRQWYDLFYSPRVWETFILLERTLTKKRFNLYKGYQRELCPGKTQVSANWYRGKCMAETVDLIISFIT